MVKLRTNHRKILAECFQRLGVNTAFDGGQQHLFRFNNLSGDHHFLWVKQVNGDSDGFPQMATYLLDHLTGQGVAFIGGFADGAYLAIVQRDAALITLLKQVANALLDGRVGGDGFKAAEVSAVAAFAERLNLNVADLANVTVATNKYTAIGDNASARTAVYAHQNRVFAPK